MRIVMKRYLSLIFILFISCANVTVPEFSHPNDANAWVHDNIQYKDRVPFSFYIQNPNATLMLRTGICADMAVLLMKILKNQFNIESEYVGVIIDINDSVYGRHALVRIQSDPYIVYYDPTAGTIYFNGNGLIEMSYPIYHVRDYNSTMFMVGAYDDI